MDKNVLEKYKSAGTIAAEVRQEVSKMIRPGLSILSLAEFIDQEIEKSGGKPAFPVNISINELAAHYTPSAGDKRRIEEKDLVKIDIGVHVDGYIGDLAWTWCSEPNQLIKAAEHVLEKAISIIKPGVTVSEIGGVIEKTAKEAGLGLIVNLTGHTLDRWQFHGQPSIPNIANNIDHEFKEGDVIALEPFIVPSNAVVKESSVVEIYRYIQDRPVRLPEARQILAMARDEWHGLPFAKRWLYKKFTPIKISMALRQLQESGAVESYPVLKEMTGMKIAQAEHTIIVSDPAIITTRL